MATHLVLRLEAPYLSFGGETVDNIGVVREYPAASMVTGMLANALGWRRYEGEKLDRLQRRLVFGARIDRRPYKRCVDYQTVRFLQKESGWTTRGQPEKHSGGSSEGTHLRYRSFDADVAVCIVLRLEPPQEHPDLQRLAQALQYPFRPLFIGRKPCLPSTPLYVDTIEAENILQALRETHSVCESLPGSSSDTVKASKESGDKQVAIFWPEGEGTPERFEPTQRIEITDQRNWQGGFHGGMRIIYQDMITLPVTVAHE